VFEIIGSRLNLSGSHDAIGHVTIGFTIGHFLVFNRECNAMVGMTLSDLKTKVKVIHFGTN